MNVKWPPSEDVHLSCLTIEWQEDSINGEMRIGAPCYYYGQKSIHEALSLRF